MLEDGHSLDADSEPVLRASLDEFLAASSMATTSVREA